MQQLQILYQTRLVRCKEAHEATCFGRHHMRTTLTGFSHVMQSNSAVSGKSSYDAEILKTAAVVPNREFEDEAAGDMTVVKIQRTRTPHLAALRLSESLTEPLISSVSL